MGQHAHSMAGCTVTSGGRTAVPAIPLAPAQHQRHERSFVPAVLLPLTAKSSGGGVGWDASISCMTSALVIRVGWAALA